MERFATAILDAQKIREESYDNEKAKEALEKELDVDFKDFYQLTIAEACSQAASNAGYDTRADFPIYLLNKYSWNDIRIWAETVLSNIDNKKK